MALLNDGDPSHERVLEFSSELTRPIVTTDWVLVETGDAFSAPGNRSKFIEFVHLLKSNEGFSIVRAGTDLDAGLELFARRPDKWWSLTDCISFQVMRRRRLQDALTADKHFAQAGFRAVFAP
ncbi:MAG: PIN domain-containing protein [Planctomycetes bacterium]|nr:PIN domain-containing protein [Planctomycetota bacterium]